MKIKKGDDVKVIRGKDKGKTGKVEIVFPKTGKVLVANINQYKRHLKAKSQTERSEIATISKPLSGVNVVVICPKCKMPTRVGFKIENNGKIRVCKKCGEAI